MSDTSVLLPSASITVFSAEENTRQVSSSLSEDWRYARVKIETVNGNVDDAILYYASYESPDLLIIQTDVIDEGFTEKLGELAGNCSEGTDAIIIGPDNDVQLYRKLISMGVSDYIVRPIEQAVFAEVIAKTLINKLGVSGSRLVVTLGSKGGVGVSSMAQALALGLSELHQQKTLVIDAAGGWSPNTIGLGLEPSTTLKESAKAAMKDDQASLNRMILKVNEKLSILASGGDSMLDEAIDREGLEKLLNMVMASYPVVIFDASSASSELKKAALMMAHKVCLFSTPGLFSLRMARTLMGEIKEVRGISDDGDNKNLLSFLINMKGLQGKKELGAKEIEGMLDQKVAGTIDFMPEFFAAIKTEGKKVTSETEGLEVINTLIKSLGETIPGLQTKSEDKTIVQSNAGGIGGILKKLTGKS